MLRITAVSSGSSGSSAGKLRSLSDSVCIALRTRLNCSMLMEARKMNSVGANST
jgi:hypothetical protein